MPGVRGAQGPAMINKGPRGGLFCLFLFVIECSVLVSIKRSIFYDIWSESMDKKSTHDGYDNPMDSPGFRRGMEMLYDELVAVVEDGTASDEVTADTIEAVKYIKYYYYTCLDIKNESDEE